MSSRTLVWCDLETTGLDPRKNYILEVALVITNENLEILAEQSWLTQYTWRHLALDKQLDNIDDIVVAMHTENGLFKETEKSQLSIKEIATMMQDFLLPHLGKTRPLLAGSSVHFDRSFLAEYTPEFNRMLSHQHFDVSTFHRVAEMWCPSTRLETSKAKPHRAMVDVKYSIEVAQHYRDIFDIGFSRLREAST